MNKNINSDKEQKIDQLIQVLGELPDEMLAQANPDFQKKVQKKEKENGIIFFVPRILTAVLILFFGIGIYFWMNGKVPQQKTVNEEKCRTTTDAAGGIPKITVIAYAAQSQTADDDMASENAKIAQTPSVTSKGNVDSNENGLDDYDEIKLTETKVNISEYSPAMSSTPAMPFSFKIGSDSKSIYIRVRTDGKGMLQKWDTSSEDGTWKLQAEGRKVKCKPNEVIYWSPKNSKAETVRLLVDIYDGDKLIEQKTIEITCSDKMTYQARLIP